MKIHTTNYVDTFIEVPADCPVVQAEIPPERKQKTVVRRQYELLCAQPYQYTSDDVLYASNGEPKGVPRAEFFSKGQPCMRASSLVKRYGWGVHCDSQGKMAIYPLESEVYQKLAADPNLKHIKSMRRKKG